MSDHEILGVRKVLMTLIDLVWETIASNLSSLTSIWWEHEDVVDKLKAFRRVSAGLIYMHQPSADNSPSLSSSPSLTGSAMSTPQTSTRMSRSCALSPSRSLRPATSRSAWMIISCA